MRGDLSAALPAVASWCQRRLRGWRRQQTAEGAAGAAWTIVAPGRWLQRFPAATDAAFVCSVQARRWLFHMLTNNSIGGRARLNTSLSAGNRSRMAAASGAYTNVAI